MEALHIVSDNESPRKSGSSRRPALRSAPINAATARYVQERLGRAIRQRRRMMDLTLQDLAGACGVTFQQVHKYESGLCSLSASQLWTIAVALEVPITYFYENLTTPELWRVDGAPVG
jgi:ribosome-binding protein aMBF1 (putative translation factor)